MAKERTKVRKAEAAATRVELQRKRRLQTLLRRGVLGIVLLAGAGAVGYCVIADRQFEAAVVTREYPAGRHLPGPISYRENPPVGGPHNVVWQNCGIYNAPIHNEHAVHSLEHGAIWITYRLDLPAADVQRLQELAADDYMLLSPYPGLPAPVVISAWNHQLQLEGVNDSRISPFIRRYKNNASTTPEFGASCSGGTTAPATNSSSLNTGGGPMAR